MSHIVTVFGEAESRTSQRGHVMAMSHELMSSSTAGQKQEYKYSLPPP